MLFFARFDLPPLNFGGVFFRSVCAHLTAEVERNEQKKKKKTQGSRMHMWWGSFYWNWQEIDKFKLSGYRWWRRVFMLVSVFFFWRTSWALNLLRDRLRSADFPFFERNSLVIECEDRVWQWCVWVDLNLSFLRKYLCFEKVICLPFCSIRSLT